MARIILASSSTYRAALLRRLGLEFEIVAPDIDESRLEDESPEDMVQRLSLLKAKAVAERAPGALIIASDQAGATRQQLLGKPGSVAAACAQLRLLSGQEARFVTGLCVLDSARGEQRVAVECCTVRFRLLSENSIRDYVERERPLDCAGSFKVEGLGIALFESLHLADPSALEGLPLIRLSSFLAELGAPVLAP